MTDFENSIEQELDFEKLTELCDNLKEAVREILNSCGMYFRIFSRVKSPNSIAEKLLRGQYGTEQNPKKLQDLVGLRVVLYYYDDLSICRDIMESTFQMVDDWSRPSIMPMNLKPQRSMVSFVSRKNFLMYTKKSFGIFRSIPRLKYNSVQSFLKAGMRLNMICVIKACCLTRNFGRAVKSFPGS